MDQKLIGWLDLLINTAVNGFNKFLEFFGLYSTKYAGWLVMALIVWIAAKIFNVKLRIGGGR